MKKLFKKYREPIMYIFFGILTFIVSVASFELFNRILGADAYMLSKALSWIVAVIFAYIVNKLWVFESKSWELSLVVKEAASFFAARIFSLLIALISMWALVKLLYFAEPKIALLRSLTEIISVESIANLCATALEVIVNYIFSKLFVFRKK